MITCLLFMQLLVAEEILIIGDKNFPKEKLTSAEIKAIFLDKKHFFGGEKILVMNYEFNHPLRICFEKNILEKTQRSLEKYWRKAYYHGKRPPKIVKSTEMLFSYLDNVQPSIGYSDTNSTKNKEVKILYKSECLF
ncbi:hypothetical protein KKC13_10935 [bacterium]|nr:hypothetical protein [bacterium]MBU1958190.1 hypothetical protein [bacterium]